MKCGKEIGEKQVFCDSCLEVMARFPVKPGTHIHLPSRTAPEPTKKVTPRKKVPTAEEQIVRMRKAIRVLSITLAAVILALGLSVAFLFDALAPEDAGKLIGQNFSTASEDESGN